MAGYPGSQGSSQAQKVIKAQYRVPPVYCTVFCKFFHGVKPTCSQIIKIDYLLFVKVTKDHTGSLDVGLAEQGTRMEGEKLSL